jgi:transposase
MAKRYRVTLTEDERKELERFSTTGKRAARKVLHARTLLLVDCSDGGPSWPTKQVSEALGISPRSIENLKKRFVEDGLPKALERKKRQTPPREVQFGGAFEAHLLALACSSPPEGRERWTIRLLADKLVELKIVPSVSAMTVCNTLKKMNLSLTSPSTGRSRPTRMPSL